jgi:hypothetical protein
MSDTHEVTLLLGKWAMGKQQALGELTPLVYKELRQLAASYLRKERQGHTLQLTALVHEAYLRLVDQKSPSWQNRSHFFGVAARLMRRHGRKCSSPETPLRPNPRTDAEKRLPCRDNSRPHSC